eukprot:TRINITY_DN23738_c0_g1_i1.p1 TRINITY_DN23738_c0_g1~~TRINITY_DN23738_c0_g1_i1.p1  ORF type:complete len:443 (+),score=70.49 TRINITY_DN23738_c0_g1_i1:69-1397(+)
MPRAEADDEVAQAYIRSRADQEDEAQGYARAMPVEPRREDGQVAAVRSKTQQPSEAGSGNSIYIIQKIDFLGSPRRVLMQNENGPCPLLAACNVLLLRNQLKLPDNISAISFHALLKHLSNYMLDSNDGASSNANVQHAVSSCIELLPKLNEGLDVNVRFTGCREFEYTRELSMFDLLDISILHGWLVSPEDAVLYEVLKAHSYNTLTEALVQVEQNGSAAGTNLPSKETANQIWEFLDRSSSQLTYEGLIGLHGALKDRELAVLYRNMHFSTLFRKGDLLYSLCTDVGFLDTGVVWEQLDVVDGDTLYLNADFKQGGEHKPTPKPTPTSSGGSGLVKVQAACPGCRARNEVELQPGQKAEAKCGFCGWQFPVKAPPPVQGLSAGKGSSSTGKGKGKMNGSAVDMVSQSCSKCGTVNQFPTPAEGQPWPRMKCSKCGHVNQL